MLVNAGQSLKTMIKGPWLPSLTVCVLGALATLQISHSSFKCTDEKTTQITVNLQTRKTMKLTFMASIIDLQPIYCFIILYQLWSHSIFPPPTVTTITRSHELSTERKLAGRGEALFKDLVFDGCGGVCL